MAANGERILKELANLDIGCKPLCILLLPQLQDGANS